jgi:hypothetical protein
VILRPEQLTSDRVTAVLRATGAATPHGFVTELGTAPVGNGKLGRCVRVTLRWSPAGAGPETVIGKFAAADDRTRTTGLASDSYRRELLFYRHLAPAVQISVPHCHAGEFDPASGDFGMLLSDAAPARPRDQLRGANLDDVALALEDVARLQAHFWGGAHLSGHEWLPVHDPASGRRRAAIYQVMAPRFVARFADRLSPEARAVVTGFVPLVRPWARAQRPPYTLVHGDLRLDNLLFDDRVGAVPLTVVDWQTVALGPGAEDAAYLVGGALSPSVRRARGEDLFAHYRRCIGRAGLSWDETACRRSYRIGALAGLHMTVVGAMLVAEDPASDVLFLSMAERHAAHASDLEALDVLARDD